MNAACGIEAVRCGAMHGGAGCDYNGAQWEKIEESAAIFKRTIKAAVIITSQSRCRRSAVRRCSLTFLPIRASRSVSDSESACAFSERSGFVFFISEFHLHVIGAVSRALSETLALLSRSVSRVACFARLALPCLAHLPIYLSDRALERSLVGESVRLHSEKAFREAYFASLATGITCFKKKKRKNETTRFKSICCCRS